MPDATPAAPSDESQDTAPVDSKPASQASATQESTVVSGGRRRGRRRVMKKKTVKDDEGYLGKPLLSLTPKQILESCTQPHEHAC